MMVIFNRSFIKRSSIVANSLLPGLRKWLMYWGYDDVPPTQYLERKHSLFKKYADQQRTALKDTKYRQISIFKP